MRAYRFPFAACRKNPSFCILFIRPCATVSSTPEKKMRSHDQGDADRDIKDSFFLRPARDEAKIMQQLNSILNKLKPTSSNIVLKRGQQCWLMLDKQICFVFSYNWKAYIKCRRWGGAYIPAYNPGLLFYIHKKGKITHISQLQVQNGPFVLQILYNLKAELNTKSLSKFWSCQSCCFTTSN
jgi:hypothetical protein